MTRLDLSEKAFQNQVIDLAKAFGWLTYHTWSSIHSAKGWPDIALCKGGRLILAELKSEERELTPDQQMWLDELSHVQGIEVYLWRPSNLESISVILQGKEGRQ
mgnify:CR=1 FL=1